MMSRRLHFRPCETKVPGLLDHPPQTRLQSSETIDSLKVVVSWTTNLVRFPSKPTENQVKLVDAIPVVFQQKV